MRKLAGTLGKLTSISALCGVLAPAIALAMATFVALPELTKESQVILSGHIDTTDRHSSSSSSGWLRFHVSGVLKGVSSVREGAVALCNSRPNPEWPDLSKLTGEAVLFLLQSPSKKCFNLSHNYRSLIEIHGDQVDTAAIEGQPESQQLDRFLEKIRSLVVSAN